METNLDLDQEYQQMSQELFQVTVGQTGTSGISTNFQQMKPFNWDLLTFDMIKKYPLIYQKLLDQTRQTQLFLPENYLFIKQQLVKKWIAAYHEKLQAIYREERFNISWYSHSDPTECRWSYDTIAEIDKTTKLLESYQI